MDSKQQVSFADSDELLPKRIDQIANLTPNRTWAEFPVSFSSYKEGYTKLSYRQLAHAINQAAHWITDEYGSGIDFETIAYSGPNDVRTPIVILGAVKAGYKILLTSPRNSIAAHKHLIEQTKCRSYVVADPEPPHVAGLCEQLGITPRRFPSLSSLLEGQNVDYPWDKTFEQAKMEPLVVIHTSGSTGLPKPLVLPHLFATRYANNQRLEAPEGSYSQSAFFHGVRLIHTLPMFHAAGVYHAVISTVFSGTTYIYLKPDAPPSAEGIAEALQHTEADAIFVAPSVVEEIGKSDHLLDFLAKRLKSICFAGGALSKPLGDRIAKTTRLISLYGSSELGQGIQLRLSGVDTEEDWSYQRWDEEACGMQFREEADNLFQMVFSKRSGNERHQPPFAIFPDDEEFYTKDLFRPHPVRKGLWTHAGRTDDIIVLSNGEKINPVSMEGQISSHPEVNGVLVTGEQRFQTVLLIETRSVIPQTASARKEFVNKLWPIVASANELAPAHARLTKDHILFTTPEKPMMRAGKGTIIRKATLRAYEQEVDALYESLENGQSLNDSLPPQRSAYVGDLPDAVAFVSKIISGITGWATFDEDANLFTLGLDSLQAIMFVRRVKSLAPESIISLNAVYSNPSINMMAKYLVSSGTGSHNGAETDVARVERMSAVFANFAAQVDQIASGNNIAATPHKVQGLKGATVVLTGSSGFAGSYLLRRLLDDAQVQRVYCLDRHPRNGKGAPQRERASGYAEMLQDDRVRARYCVLSQPNLGLQEEEYMELRESVDVIIHAAWAVDFNQKLDAYNDQLQGLVGLFSLVSQSAKAARLLFVSSISAVQAWIGSIPVPETISYDALCAAKTGYGESKHIAERLVDYAAKQLGQNNLIIRAGQIAGPILVAGGWNRYEWLPSLVASSAYLGVLPDALGAVPTHANGAEAVGDARTNLAQLVDWIPVDVFAQLTVEAAAHMLSSKSETRESSRAAVVHAVNPRTTTWKDLLPGVISSLSEHRGQPVKVMSYPEWVKVLESSALEDRAMADVEAFAAACPAVKLLQFFQERALGDLTPPLDTKLAESVSPSLGAVAPLSPEVMRRWIPAWLAQ